jgi:hypothetical protein
MARARTPSDPRGGHIRLYWTLTDSPAWRALSHVDVRVYIAMRRRLGKTNNGDIDATLGTMRGFGIKSGATLAKSLRALETLGFIAKTRQGGIANGGKRCSLYRFTDEATFDIPKAGHKATPATNEWQRFASIAQAQAVLRQAHEAAKRPEKNNRKPRAASRSASPNESESRFSDSIREVIPKSPTRRMSRRNGAAIVGEPA